MQVYADNAATTKMSKVALKAMFDALENTYGNPSSMHKEGQKASKALKSARESIAVNLGCLPEEIYFTSGGTESDNHAILSAAAAGEKIGKKHIVSTTFEHHAILHTLDRLVERGFEITLLDVHHDGLVRLDELSNALKDETCLVTITYANNEIGTVQPIADIGRICKERGILFHTDAVQVVGYLQLDVNSLNIDMLSLSAHKFHGPKGVGVFYARKGLSLVNVIEGGAQEKGKRAGTENVPGIVAMAAAMDEAYLKMPENRATVARLRDRLIAGLEKIPYSVLNGDRQSRLPNNVSFCFEGVEGESLLLYLDQLGICVSSGSACTSGSLEPSHVLLAIGRPHELAHGSLRLSLCSENTEEEIDYIIESVTSVVERLRALSPVWRDLTEGKREHVI